MIFQSSSLLSSAKWFYEVVRNAIERAYFAPEKLGGAQVFGELVGPKINGNPYGLKEHLWLPFDYLEGKYFFRFWRGFARECAGKTDEEIFESTSDLFKGLWSIYKRQHGIKGEVNEAVIFENSMAAEGVVFYNQKTGGMCKLRRDMFAWYRGRRHEL